MPKGEIVIDPRTGEAFEVVWDAAAERQGRTFHLVADAPTRTQPELQPRGAARPLRLEPFRSW